MKILHSIRDRVSVVIGLFFTVLIGLITIVGGVPYRVAIDWWARRYFQNPFELMPNLWSWILEDFCYCGIRGATVEIEGGVIPAQENELVVCIANHPPDLAAASLVRFLTHRVCARVTVIGKRQLLFLPFLGWALWAIRGAIFINRKNQQSAFTSIRKGISRMLGRATTIILFPDMHRATDERIGDDWIKFATTIPEVRNWLKYTLVPRSGGLLELLSAIDRPVRIINITIAPTIVPAKAGIPHQEVLRIRVEEAHLPLPLEKRSLEAWLNLEWRRKNHLIDTWSGHDAAGRVETRSAYLP